MVKINRSIPVISVGILTADKIRIKLNGYFSDRYQHLFEGDMEVRLHNDLILLETVNGTAEVGRELVLSPLDENKQSFTLHDVVIGIGFHWQKNEDQVFRGQLKIQAGDSGLTAINMLWLEDYLISVISSEMKATSSPEMLKAHAVISRSWLLAQIEKRQRLQSPATAEQQSAIISENEITKWYDREDHTGYDVCADDHCQRYQGITKATSENVEKAVNETSGEVLTYADQLCDSRFSKCCGGITEIFENVWEPVNHPYLQKLYDSDADIPVIPDLSDEASAKNWILTNPPAFCNTADREILSQVLNDYDQTTQDFYRWNITYTSTEIGDLIRTRTGIDFGQILDLVPLQRGVSGRLIKLKIVGTKKTMIIGKELEIRKALSKTHLYSAAFVVEKQTKEGQLHFILHGAGWGHGVGLCQIGAAVMGAKGYHYKQILMHYFRGAEVRKKY